jgi:hypothetical protein
VVTVTVDGPIAVTIAPASTTTMLPGQTQQFSASTTKDPGGMSNVTWVLRDASNVDITSPASNATQLSSTGLLSVGIVSADNTVFKVVAKDKTDSSRESVVSVTVHGPTTVHVTPSTVSLLPGDSYLFTALVDNVTSAHTSDVAWTLVGCSSSSIFDSTTGLLHVDSTLSSGGTCTLRATSNVDATQHADATITIAADASGLSGTVRYAGAKQGRVYVTCVDQDNPKSASRTIALMDTSFASAVPFRLPGGVCASTTGSTITAWMDTLDVDHFVFGADPIATATVSSSVRTATLVLADYVAARPPSTVTAPSIVTILNETNGAVVLFNSYVDSSTGREYAQSYDILYGTSSILDSTSSKITVKPGNLNAAFIPLTTGTYYFGVQATFTSAGGTVTKAPATVVASTATTIPPSGASIAGTVDLSGLSGLTLNSGALIHALAFDATGTTHVPLAAGNGAVSAGPSFADYEVRAVSNGTYGLWFFLDANGNGQVDPWELWVPLFDPTLYLTNGVATPGFAQLATVAGSMTTALQTALPLQNPGLEGHILTDVTITGPTPTQTTTTQTTTVVYALTSGTKRLAQATRLKADWEADNTRMLYCPEHLARAQVEQRNTFVASTTLGTSATQPTNGATQSFLVQYAGRAVETVTVPVQVLSVTMGNPPNPSTSGTVSSPVSFSWTPSTTAVGKSIMSYKITVQDGIMPTVLTLPGSAITATYTNGSLMAGTTYAYTLEAVDQGGDRVRYVGSFATP